MKKEKQLKHLGEFGFLEHIRNTFPARGTGVIKGIGDDCAVLESPEGERLLWTVDTLVEDVHFRMDLTDAYSLGWKSLAVNLSDIAAMGGQPLYALVSLGLRADSDLNDLEAFYRGFSDLAREHGVEIVGGDTVKSPSAHSITVSVLGRTRGGRLLCRDNARSGDWIVVTGPLGQSAAGLSLLMAHEKNSPIQVPEPVTTPLVRAHRMPVPQVREGLFLAGYPQVHAAIDLSDGLVQDLWHVCRLSGVGACIQQARLPLSAPTCELEKTLGLSAEAWALSGGEDYQLLATVAADALEEIQSAFSEEFQKPLYPIGQAIPEQGVWLEKSSGERQFMEPGTGGYDHFMEKP